MLGAFSNVRDGSDPGAAEEGHRHTKNALAISGRHMGLPEVPAGPQVEVLESLVPAASPARTASMWDDVLASLATALSHQDRRY